MDGVAEYLKELWMMGEITEKEFSYRWDNQEDETDLPLYIVEDIMRTALIDGVLSVEEFEREMRNIT